MSKESKGLVLTESGEPLRVLKFVHVTYGYFLIPKFYRKLNPPLYNDTA